MIAINMPGGSVEYIDGEELLWMRQAFDHEFKDTVMLRLANDRIYSVEPLSELSVKFTQAGIAIAQFTPPEGKIAMLVSAERVREVEAANPSIYPEAARSVLKFSTKVKLAVRESQAEAECILADVRRAVP